MRFARRCHSESIAMVWADSKFEFELSQNQGGKGGARWAWGVTEGGKGAVVRSSLRNRYRWQVASAIPSLERHFDELVADEHFAERCFADGSAVVLLF